MPMIFFISAKKDENNLVSLKHAADIINKHIDQSKFLTDCGFDGYYQPAYKTIALHIPTIYSFDEIVAERAKYHINEYLVMTGLSESFYISSIANSTRKFVDSDFIPHKAGMAIQQSKFAIELKPRHKGLGLYRNVAMDITTIANEIKEIMGLRYDLQLGINYDHDNENYKIHFLNFSIKNKNDLLLFKGDVILCALKNKNFYSDYKIEDFDENEYYEVCSKSINPQQNIKNELSSISAEQDNDEILYSENISENKESIKEQMLKNILKKYGYAGKIGPDYQYILRKAAANKYAEDLQFIIDAVPGIDVNKQDDNPYNKKTALHLAVIKGSIECVNVLINAKAEWNICDASQKTALDYAKERNDKSMLDLFRVDINLTHDLATLKL